MKHIVALLCAIATLFSAQAGEKQKVKLSSLKRNGSDVKLTVTSNNEFYVGGNKHVLYVSGNHYDRYDQANDDGKGSLSFYIPSEDFKKLKDGAKVYLSYGLLEEETEKELEELCQQSLSPCWQVGKLSKKQLK